MGGGRGATAAAGANLVLLILGLSFFAGIAAGDWNILNYITRKDAASGGSNNFGYSITHYCESWRINVEVHNIRGFEVIPGECVNYIGNYMTSTQYVVDVQRAAEECVLFLTNEYRVTGDGKDAWIFDIDDVLLSTIPYYKKHQFGNALGCSGSVTNKTSLEAWMGSGVAPALEHMVPLFQLIRARGLKVIILSSRPEYLREATVANLVSVGYHGWTELILRCKEQLNEKAEHYKAEERRKLEKKGYRIWGIVGSQWSSLGGYTTARRIFKLPNPMYYEY